ncbi:MAG: CBS domain-containing protein [Nitrososphaerota archaeon]|nr:CBS domain-containing protein [Nitrososphaerota archaeon]
MSSSLVEPRQLRKIRTQLGYTQGRLAKAAGVSQSIIAKIEAGSVDPTYGTLAAISKALSSVGRGKVKKAADVMSSPVVGVQEDATIRECAALMRRKGFSQVPVFSGERMVGTLTDSHIMDLLAASSDPQGVLGEKVKGHVEPVFAVVGKDTPVDALFSLFKYLPAVLVESEEKIQGIVTKIDLLAAEGAG